MDFRLKECLESLGEEKNIIEKDAEKDAIVDRMINTFPPTPWGRIDWDKIQKKILLKSKSDIVFELKKVEKK